MTVKGRGARGVIQMNGDRIHLDGIRVLALVIVATDGIGNGFWKCQDSQPGPSLKCPKGELILPKS